jgi:hypothetical protein
MMILIFPNGLGDLPEGYPASCAVAARPIGMIPTAIPSCVLR